MTGSWTSTVQFLLVEALVVGSTLVWLNIAWRFRSGNRLLEAHPANLAGVPLPAVAGVIGWLAFQMMARLTASPEKPQEIPLLGIQMMAAINLMIAALLPLILTDGGHRRLSTVGLTLDTPLRQLTVGGLGFLAAVWPTGLLLLASRQWRSVDTQHAYLQALRDATGGELIAWIIISAVIAAPLAEELLFRVVLQGWLSERLPGPAAIGMTALIFALVHGWRDALPLVPLSIILGYLYYQTRYYWACVVTHALFNGTNLAMVLLTTETPD
jgi:hypothetical protein